MVFILYVYFVIGLVYAMSLHLTDIDLINFTKENWKTPEFFLGFLIFVILWPFIVVKRNSL